MTTFNDLAPWPETVEQATAETLAKNLAVYGLANQQRLLDALGTGDSDSVQLEAIPHIVNAYGLVKLLRALGECDRDRADEVARGLWADWDAGDSLGEWLWEWLTEYGIDPKRVAEVAAQAKPAT